MHSNRILFVHQGFELYGSDRSFLSFCQKQTLFLRSLTDIVLSRDGDLSDMLKGSGYNVTYLGMGRLPMYIIRRNPLRYVILLVGDVYKAALFLRRYELVYINTIAPLAWLIAAALLNKRRSIHIREIPSKKIAVGVSLLMLTNCKVIFNSTATKTSFRSLFRLNAVVVDNGVESLKEQVDNSVEYTNVFEDSLFNVLVPGRINSWKGQNFVLECIREFDLAFEGINWVFAGDVAINQEWRYEGLKRIIDYDSVETINFLGWRNDLANLMFNSDLVVVPSIRPEPFGRVVIEAMSIGRLVLASNHGGPADIITSDQNGFLFEPLNKESFRDKLIGVKNLSGKKRQKIESAAIQEFENKYSEKKYLKNLSDELEKHFIKADKA